MKTNRKNGCPKKKSEIRDPRDCFQACGILPVAEEQSRTRGGQRGGVADQSQRQRLWRSRTPHARSISRSPSSPPPSFTPSPFAPRSLVRDGQTSPHRPRLVVSRSTCPPLSPSPHANSFIIGTAVINTTYSLFDYLVFDSLVHDHLPELGHLFLVGNIMESELPQRGETFLLHTGLASVCAHRVQNDLDPPSL